MTSPRGTYATVRRYSFSYLTDVYDVFYPFVASATDFKPLAVNFERDIRVVSGLDATGDKWRIAKQEPFTFMFWPDPAVATLDGEAPKTDPYTTGSTDPRAGIGGYWSMAGRTSYMFTFPMFPAL